MVREFHRISSLRTSNYHRFLANATDSPFCGMSDLAWTLPCGHFLGSAQDFTSPSPDDWILVLDAHSHQFAPPGQGAA